MTTASQHDGARRYRGKASEIQVLIAGRTFLVSGTFSLQPHAEGINGGADGA